MLIIKDLAASKALDRNAMASVVGGTSYSAPAFPFKSITKEKVYDVQKEYEFSSDIGIRF